MPPKRKFQVCNGYLLEFDQLARVINFMAENPSIKRVYRKELEENTGLSNRQLESLVSIGSALGLIQPRKQILTPAGNVIVKHDIFIEANGTLEWCHYAGAGSYKNLIWYEIFNKLLPDKQPMTREGWTGYLRSALAGKYTDRTMGKHLQQEVRFVVDAYLNRNFKKLELLHQTSDGRLYERRYINIDPLVFSSILYDYADKRETKLLQVTALTDRPGSPGRLFAMDDPTIRKVVEQLHEKGWVHYEGTHNLDQIRLREGFTALEFLKAYYEDREPCPEP